MKVRKILTIHVLLFQKAGCMVALTLKEMKSYLLNTDGFIIIQIISLLIRTIRTYMVVAASIMREKKLLLAYIRQFLPFLMVCHE